MTVARRAQYTAACGMDRGEVVGRRAIAPIGVGSDASIIAPIGVGSDASIIAPICVGIDASIIALIADRNRCDGAY